LKKSDELNNDYNLGGALVDGVIPYSLEFFLGIKEEGEFDDDIKND
jgi:hypothetical protein